MISHAVHAESSRKRGSYIFTYHSKQGGSSHNTLHRYITLQHDMFVYNYSKVAFMYPKSDPDFQWYSQPKLIGFYTPTKCFEHNLNIHRCPLSCSIPPLVGPRRQLSRWLNSMLYNLLEFWVYFAPATIWSSNWNNTRRRWKFDALLQPWGKQQQQQQWKYDGRRRQGDVKANETWAAYRWQAG